MKGDDGRKGAEGEPGRIGDAGPSGTPVSLSWLIVRSMQVRKFGEAQFN